MWFLLPSGLSLLLGYVWWRKMRFKRTLENVPTSKVQGVFIGMNEVKGKAECNSPLTTFLAQTEAVWYSYDVSEHWRRTRTYTDSKGRTKTRTESGWSTVASGGDLAPFDLRDDTGAILVDGNGADIDGFTVFSETCGRSDPLYYDKGPEHAIANSTGRRRFIETAIAPGDVLYIIGSAQLREDVAAPFIGHDRRDPYYMISVRSEEKIVSSANVAAWAAFIFGMLLALAVPIAWSAENDPRGWQHSVRKEVIRTPAGRQTRIVHRNNDPGFWSVVEAHKGELFIAAVTFGALIGLLYAQLVYNGLIRSRNRLDRALSLIDIQLKRRHDLIPSLVNVVKGLAAHEKELQESLAQMRGVGARQVVTNGLMALKEAYPEITSNENFATLFDQIKDAEDRISLARGFYNDSLQVLRDRMQTFPDVIIARLFAFKQGKPLPPLQEFERSVPKAS